MKTPARWVAWVVFGFFLGSSGLVLRAVEPVRTLSPKAPATAVTHPSVVSKVPPAWIAAEAAKVVKSPSMTLPLVRADARQELMQWAILGSMEGVDIEALAFLVLMESAKSAQEDVAAIMASTKAEQDKQRAILRLSGKLKDPNDSLSEVSPAQQLKLQLATDRKKRIDQMLAGVNKR